jgi:hypothetical protein
MGLLCIKFPSLRRKKSPKEGRSPEPARKVDDEKAAVRALANAPRAAVPFIHVNSVRIEPLSADEFLDGIDADATGQNVYFAKRATPIVIGTTDEKRVIAAEEIIRELREASMCSITHEEYRRLMKRRDPRYVFVAVDRNGEFCFLVEIDIGKRVN